MKAAVMNQATLDRGAKTVALESGFPAAEVSRVAEQESWRKEINRPLYHIHKWWATRLGSVFRAITLAALSDSNTDVWNEFYKHHNFADKVVLDPFMGSGTTLGEAVKLGAKAIGCDINPISTFLVQQAFTRVPEAQLRAAFERLANTVAPQIRKYYQTRDPETGELIPALYHFWVKTVQTPEGEVIPLFSRYVFSQNAYPKRKPNSQIVCPKCWEILEARYDITSLKCSHCGCQFNPQSGPAKGQYITTEAGHRYRIKDLIAASQRAPEHRQYAILALRANGEKIYLPVRDEDRELYLEAEARLEHEVLPLPTLDVRPGNNTDQARGYNYNYWREFFNARQLLCLGLLLRSILEIQDRAIQEQLLCLFSSTLEFNNLFCSFKGEGTGAVRHMFSNHILKPERTPLENSVWGTDKSSGTFSTLFESRLMRAKRYLDEPFEIGFDYDLRGERQGTRKTAASDPIHVQIVSTWNDLQSVQQGLMVLNGDSSHLPIPDNSVDAVITDPPYFDFVHYSELSDFFYAWLAPVLKDRYSWFARQNSFHKGEVQHKDPHVFAKQLTSVFLECHRVLKDDGLFVFSFHHSRAEGWGAIYQALIDSHFHVVAAHPVHAEMTGASPKSSSKDPISVDILLICKKNSVENSLHRDLHAYSQDLGSAGFRLSQADYFNVQAGALLIESHQKRLPTADVLCQLNLLKSSLSATRIPVAVNQ